MASLCSWFKEFTTRFNCVWNWNYCLHVCKKEQGNRCFVGAEKYVMWAIIVAAITSIYMLLTGNIKCKKSFSFKGLFFV